MNLFGHPSWSEKVISNRNRFYFTSQSFGKLGKNVANKDYIQRHPIIVYFIAASGSDLKRHSA